MKRFKAHIIAIVIVTLWAVFAYAYLGIEDGSSGLSILGKVSTLFFIPGGLLMQIIKVNTNSDIPVMAFISWIIYILIALIIAQITTMILNRRKTKKFHK